MTPEINKKWRNKAMWNTWAWSTWGSKPDKKGVAFIQWSHGRADSSGGHNGVSRKGSHGGAGNSGGHGSVTSVALTSFFVSFSE